MRTKTLLPIFALLAAGLTAHAQPQPAAPPSAAPSPAPVVVASVPAPPPAAAPAAPPAAPASAAVAKPQVQAMAFAINRDAGVETLTHNELMQALRGDMGRWPSGAPVRIILPPGNSAEFKALMTFLGTKETIYRRKLNERLFRNEIKKPISVKTGRAVPVAVFKTHGAVGLGPKFATDKVIWVELDAK
jgi:hypothetical protein